MSLRDVVDALARSAAVRDRTIQLSDPEAGPDRMEASEGYFSVRLSEMRLTDERRWLVDITPAVFVIGEYDYTGTRVRKPCFVSNELLGPMGGGIDPRKLRVNFANTLLMGPTPYAGGDVDLFVGLFQTATEERMTAMFGMFETLFSKIGGPVAAGIALAHELLPAVLKCLGTSDIRCLLADRRAIGEQSLPTNFYLAYLRGKRGQEVDAASLQIRDRQLMRAAGGATVPVDDIDYCLIQVQCHATRNDYTSLPFHKVWLEAQRLTGAGNHTAAQASMLECAQQILVSPDLTESHKLALIRLYQAKLLATRGALADAGLEKTRSGTELTSSGMSARVRQAGGFHAAALVEHMDDLARLSIDLEERELEEASLQELLANAAPAAAGDTAALVRTLTLGSVAQ
jgi:hypothetical protein